MHTLKPDLVSKNRAGFTDPAAKHIFLDVVKAAAQGKDGFVDYFWSKTWTRYAGPEDQLSNALCAMGLGPCYRYVLRKSEIARRTN
jgi:signal transduction histidine kinase